MGSIATIPLHKLKPCEHNIRRSAASDTADLELRASIQSHGILVSLIVVKEPKGIYRVIAGARRMSALQALVKEKKLAKSYPVPCYVLDETENEEEAALIENTMREEMHPIDEFESYFRLHHTEHLSIDDIAARFGKTALQIKQRLALGAALPLLRTLCREGKLSLDSLCAYTGAGSDWDAQEKCYNALKAEHSNNIPTRIRQYYANNCGYTSNHKLVRFVGLDAYTAAGGRYTSDLFSDTCYLHDPQIITNLVKAKLEEASEQAKSQGWSWVEVDMEHMAKSPSRVLTPVLPDETSTKIQELQTKIEALQARSGELYDLIHYPEDSNQSEDDLASHEAEIERVDQEIEVLEKSIEEMERTAEHTAEQKKSSGCIVTLDHNGALSFVRGVMKKGQASPSLQSTDEPSQAPAEEPEKLEYSQALLTDLVEWHLSATKLDLAYSEDIAFKLAMFSVAWEMLSERFHYEPLAIKVSDGQWSDRTTPDMRAAQASEELLGLRKNLDLSWICEDGDITKSWIAFQELPFKHVTKIIGWCAARALRTDRPGSDQFIQNLKREISANPAKYWRPTLENFFGRCSRAMLLQIGCEVFQDEDYADNHPTASKRDLAVWISEEVDRMDTKNCWLPPLMRTSTEARPGKAQ